MYRVSLIAAPLVFTATVILPPLPSTAQAQSVSRTGEQCQEQKQERRRSGRRLGGILGGIAGNLGSRVGGVASVVSGYLPVGELLGEAIASMLDCDEQQKAAGATQQAVEQAERGGGVGTTAAWESTTRPGVTGSSTVTAQDDGGCMTVTDVVIVDGEETRAPKRMCRRPPSNRFVRV
jgi:surface antigen